MSVGVSPDGRTLAVDLQGSIWTLPAAGGAATRITDIFNDARQPAWSPDGKWIAFFAYRDGGYDIWAIAPDGTNQHKLTWGAVRRSRAGLVARRHARRLLVRSRQPARQRLQHLDARRPQRRAPQLTKDALRRLHAVVVAGRQGDCLRVGARRTGSRSGRSTSADGAERKVVDRRAAASTRRRGAAADKSSTTSRPAAAAAPAAVPRRRATTSTASRSPATKTCSRSAPSWASPTDFYYVSDGKIRKRELTAGAPQTIEFTRDAAGDAGRDSYTRRKRDFTSTTPRQVLGHRLAGDLARRQADRVRRDRRHLRHAGRRQAGQPHQGRGARHRSGVVARRHAARLFVRQGQRAPAALDPRHEDRAGAARSPT